MTVRQEIHAFIDDINESKLIALRPLLRVLADEAVVIETELTGEEREIIMKGMEEYEANPGVFVPLENIV